MHRKLSTSTFLLDIEEETARSSRHTLFTYLDDFDPAEIESFRSFLDKVDGVIVEEARNRELLELLGSSGVPTVLLAPTEALEGLDLVTMDLAAGARKAVRYLRGRGHERIAIVNGPLRLDSARIRFQAWKDAMKDTGGTTEDCLVDGDEGWSAEAGYAVYCVEGCDAAIPLDEIALQGGTCLEAAWKPDLLGGIVTLKGPGYTAIPYHLWANRGTGPMRVWLANGA